MHDFTIRKEYEDKTKKSKKSWTFQFLDVRVQWKFHVFKKKNAETVSLCTWVYIFSKIIVFHVFCKNLSWIWPYVKELQTKKWWFFHEKYTFEKYIQNLENTCFFENLDENSKVRKTFSQAWGAFSKTPKCNFSHQTELTRNSYKFLCNVRNRQTETQP